MNLIKMSNIFYKISQMNSVSSDLIGIRWKGTWTLATSSTDFTATGLYVISIFPPNSVGRKQEKFDSERRATPHRMLTWTCPWRPPKWNQIIWIFLFWPATRKRCLVHRIVTELNSRKPKIKCRGSRCSHSITRLTATCPKTRRDTCSF